MHRTINNAMLTTLPISKVIDGVVLAAAFVFNAVVLDADYLAIAVACGGSFSGAVILAYFRPDVTLIDRFFKVLCSAIGGLVLGTVLQEYLHIESPAYRLGLFFFCSMLALVVLRSLLSLTENNVSEMLRGVLQRVFNLRVETERVKHRVARTEEKVDQLIKKEGE